MKASATRSRPLRPADAFEAPRALGPHPAERVEQPIRMVDALGVAPHLLADDAVRVGVPVRPPDVPDGALVDLLYLEGASASAIVRADGGDDLEPGRAGD